MFYCCYYGTAGVIKLQPHPATLKRIKQIKSMNEKVYHELKSEVSPTLKSHMSLQEEMLMR